MRTFGYTPMYYHASFWPEGLIALVINILVWGLIVFLIMHLVRKIAGYGHHGCCGMHGGDHNHNHGDYETDSDSSYMDIVKRRYATGDIDKKEYEELKKEFSHESTQDIEDTPKE